MRDKQLIMKIIEEIEKQSNGVNIRSARGYGAGHPWIKRTATNLGAHENDEDEEVNLADLGPPDIERLIADGFDPQIELALLLVRSQILAEMGGEGWNDRPQVAGGDATDLRSRAGGR